MRNIRVWLIIVATILLLAFVSIPIWSFPLAIISSGYQTTDMRIMLKQEDFVYREVRITLVKDKHGKYAFLNIIQNKFGWWVNTPMIDPADEIQYPDGTTAKNKLAIGYWGDFLRGSNFSFFNESKSYYEQHFFFRGDNAGRLVDIPINRLPPETIYNVEQTGSYFLLHIVSYSSDVNGGKLLNDIPILLHELQLIGQ